MSYIDLLTKIKNAQAVKKENVKIPYSKMNEAVADILAKNKYLAGFEKKGRGPKKILDIRLKYQEGQGAVTGIKFVSKPSRRIYIGYADLKPVKQGYGIGVISTPKGIKTTMDAKKNKIGGEILFEIW